MSLLLRFLQVYAEPVLVKLKGKKSSSNLSSALLVYIIIDVIAPVKCPQMTAKRTDCQSAENERANWPSDASEQKLAVIFLAHNLFLSIMSKYLVVARVHSKPSD